MDCLVGYIGLSSRVETVAESGLYVDTLPDISIDMIEGITEKNEEIIKLWNSVEKRSILKFRTLFISEVNRCHRLAKIDVCECLICENKSLLATSLWYLMGAELLTENLGSPRINRFTTIDRNKNKEVRNELMYVFTRELETAVAGIDIHSSSCVEVPVEEKNITTFHTPII